MNDFPIRVNMGVGTLGGRVNMGVGTQITPRAGATSYEDLEDKPSINGVELAGNKTFAELGEQTITNAELAQIINEQYNMIFGG